LEREMGFDESDSLWHPIVAVPARNEAQRLPSLIDSLGRQTWLAGPERRLPVVLILNNCNDHSAATAIRAAARHQKLLLDVIQINFPTSQAHVGSARRLAMERALELANDRLRSVLLTTDGDAVPRCDWIENNLRAIDEGAAIVGGHIIGDRTEEAFLGPHFLRRARHQLYYGGLIDRLKTLIDPIPHDPWPRHSDHTGASLAVRADVYAAVGGIPALPFREDLALVSLVRGAGYRLRHPLDIQVQVSARLDGRAPGGMADCLKSWLGAEADGLPHLVEDPKSVVARLRKRRMCRQFGSLGDWVMHPVRSSVSSRSFRRAETVEIERIAPDEPDAPLSVPVKAAIRQIKRMIADKESETCVV
jgi:Glycosyl transferase family 2